MYQIFLPHPNPHATCSTWGNPIALGVSPWEKTAVAPLLPKGEASAKGEACGVSELDFSGFPPIHRGATALGGFPDLFAQRLPLGEASGVGLRGVILQLKSQPTTFETTS